MSYNIQVNGAKGPYDNKITDSSIRYGRNAVENHVSYMEMPLVSDIPNPAPILDFSTSPQAGENNIKSLETFIDKRTPEPMKEQMQKGLAGIAKYFAEKIK